MQEILRPLERRFPRALEASDIKQRSADLSLAKKIRGKIYKFMAKHLKPEKLIQIVEQLMKAGYR